MQLNRFLRVVTSRPHLSEALAGIDQPLTTSQLAKRLGASLDLAGYQLWLLAQQGLVECVNPSARHGRLYYLAVGGHRAQALLRKTSGLPPLSHTLPPLDWDLYGWLCFRHRSAVVKTLDRPLRPAQIKRRARMRDERVRMSAGNVREIIKLLVRRGVARPVERPHEPFPMYELTTEGSACRDLLLRAEVPR